MEQAELLWSNSHERPLYGGEFYRTLLQRTISVISLIFETVQNLPKKWGAGGGMSPLRFQALERPQCNFLSSPSTNSNPTKVPTGNIYINDLFVAPPPPTHTHTHTHTFAGKPRVLPCYISFAIYLHIANTPDFQEILKTRQTNNCVISIYFGAMSQIFIKFHGDSDTNMTLNDLL